MVLPCSMYSVSTVPLASQNTVSITLWDDATMRNLLGGGKEACFQAKLCTLLSGSRWWSQISPAVTKLSGFSLNRRSRPVNAWTWSAFWTSDNIRGSHFADTLLIDKFCGCGKIKCVPRSLRVPTDAAMKPTNSRWSVITSLVDFLNSFFVERSWQSSTLVLVIRRWSPSCKFSMSLCKCNCKHKPEQTQLMLASYQSLHTVNYRWLGFRHPRFCSGLACILFVRPDSDIVCRWCVSKFHTSHW